MLELLLNVVGAGVVELLLDVVGAGVGELLLDVVGSGMLWHASRVLALATHLSFIASHRIASQVIRAQLALESHLVPRNEAVRATWKTPTSFAFRGIM